MERPVSPGPMLACSLHATEFQDRGKWISDLNRTALRSAKYTDLQLELIYAGKARTLVPDMVRNKAACCGLLTVEVHQQPDTTHVVIQGPASARVAVTAAFQILRSIFRSGAPAQSACGCCGAAP
jgi:hypothetical protein